jgi:dTDP-4-amino-4,6-dideoxygalactose transaminase
LQAAYAGRIRVSGGMENTERAYREILSLPMYPELALDELKQVSDGVRSFKFTGRIA